MRVPSSIQPHERATLLVEIWKQSTQVQQHFNDVSMKVRKFAIVIFSAVLTGIGLSIHKSVFLQIFSFEISAAVLFAFAGAFVTQLIHFMDTYWYHIFLKSAVDETLKIENKIKPLLKIEKLSDGISKASQSVQVISLLGLIHLPIGYKEMFIKIRLNWLFKAKNVDSSTRHAIFYRWLIMLMILAGLLSAFIEPQATQNPSNKFLHSGNVPEVYFVSGNNVRLREGNSQNSAIRAIIQNGQRIQVLLDDGTTWIKVRILINNQSKVGYIHRDFIDNLK
ncbi:SH3 domain-containing protein [Psychrosphaera haliotis]|uniref:SH3 domain-containing protein n=1 Tax=Psychrosphaera haliotis TaxID=555083 RepID=A0A6N8FAZ0_9GAMM|nr:SH3 domain-containing protein [Psychrosphaera haliotis]MUH73633.1 SH3 domain-containing protein [Psychrosphaera haliotis]